MNAHGAFRLRLEAHSFEWSFHLCSARRPPSSSEEARAFAPDVAVARGRGFAPLCAHRLKWGGGHVVRARPCRGPASKGGARRLRRCARTGASRSWSLAVRRAFHTPPFAAGSGALRARSVVLCGLFAWSAVGSLLRFLFPLGGRRGPAGGPRSGPRAWSRGANLMEFSIEWSETTR